MAPKSKEEEHSANLPPTVVLPGDDLTEYILGKTKDVLPPQEGKSQITKPKKLGVGLQYDPNTETVRATRAGLLRHRSSTYFVQSNIKRYIPMVGDRVVGIVEERAGGLSPDYYSVNIFGPHPARLHQLSFEGAIKRNRPHLDPGDAVYCRVSSMSPQPPSSSSSSPQQQQQQEMMMMTTEGQRKSSADVEVSCKAGGDGLDGGASRKDWMTDEGTYGQLKGGTIFRTSLGLARELLSPNNVVLDALGRSEKDYGVNIPFEVAIGSNGAVWVHAERPEFVVLVTNAIQNSEVMTPSQVRGMVKSLIQTVKQSILDSE